MDVEYIIVGDTEKFNDCLVYVIGKSIEDAERVLNRMLNNPTDNDKKLIKDHTNLRIKKVNSEDCWWNKDYD